MSYSFLSKNKTKSVLGTRQRKVVQLTRMATPLRLTPTEAPPNSKTSTPLQGKWDLEIVWFLLHYYYTRCCS